MVGHLQYAAVRKIRACAIHKMRGGRRAKTDRLRRKRFRKYFFARLLRTALTSAVVARGDPFLVRPRFFAMVSLETVAGDNSKGARVEPATAGDCARTPLAQPYGASKYTNFIDVRRWRICGHRSAGRFTHHRIFIKWFRAVSSSQCRLASPVRTDPAMGVRAMDEVGQRDQAPADETSTTRRDSFTNQRGMLPAPRRKSTRSLKLGSRRDHTGPPKRAIQLRSPVRPVPRAGAMGTPSADLQPDTG